MIIFFRAWCVAGLLLLMGCGGGGGGGTVAPNGGGNTAAPIAHAGADLSVRYGAAVTLDGSQSSDPQGQGLSYAWTQTAGTAVTLVNANGVSPNFVAPATAGVLTFSLQVSAGGRTSTADTVSVTVLAVGYRAGQTIDPAGRARTDYVRAAHDPAGESAMVLYAVSGRTSEGAGGAITHFYATHFDGSSWGAPVLLDGGAPNANLITGNVASLGAGRYLASWIKPTGFSAYEIQARFYDPANGWGAMQTAVSYNAGFSGAYVAPDMMYIAADAGTGNALVMWEDAYDNVSLVEYRGGAWGAMRGMVGDSVSSFACRAGRCVVLTQAPGYGAYAVVYDQATGAISSSVLDANSHDFRAQQVVANDAGMHAVWPRFFNNTSTVMYGLLPAGGSVWSVTEIAASTATSITGGRPQIAAANGELKAFFTRSPPFSSDTRLYARTFSGGVWSSTEEAVRETPPDISDSGSQVAYVGAGSDMQIVFPVSGGFIAKRRVAGIWQADITIDTSRSGIGTYYGAFLLAYANGRALFVADDTYEPQANWTDTLGAWGGTQVLPAENIFGGSGGVRIATASNGSAMAVWLQYELGDAGVFAAFKPAGGSWQVPRRLTELADAALSVQVFAVDANRFAAVWKARRGNGAQMFGAVFDIGATTWTAATPGGSAAFDPNFGAATDNDGRVLAAWYEPITNMPTVYGAVYNATANTWGAKQPINDVSVSASDIGVGSDAANSFAVVWKQASTTPGQVRARRYISGVWSIGTATLDDTSVFPVEDRSPPAVVSTQAGEYMACWSARAELGGTSGNDYESSRVRCSRYNTDTWAAAVTVNQITRSSLGYGHSKPALVAVNGQYVLAWAGCASAEPGRWRASRYVGSVWQAPVELHSLTGSSSQCDDTDDAAPAIARDSNNNLLVVWSGTPFPNVASGYAAYFDAASAQWTLGHRFESDPGETGAVHAASRAGGGFELVWSQEQGTRFAIHASGTE